MPSGSHPNSRANLKPARRGEVRNPEGKNRKRPITDRYLEVSEEPMPLKLIHRFNRKWKAQLLFEGDSWARGAALGLFCAAALDGEVRAGKEIREAIEGKAPQRLEIATPPNMQITVRVVNDRRKFDSFSVMEPRQAQNVLSKAAGLAS